MKGMFFSAFLFIVLEGFGQEIVTRSQKHPDIDFSKYSTYYWAQQVDQELDEGYFFLNDLVLKSDIRDAVRGGLEARGYRVKKSNPDLIVNFRVFDRPVVLKGLQGYGSSYWRAEEYDATTDNRTVEVQAGTLIISLIDRQRGLLVWQGFSSGLIDGDAFIKDEEKIREAVHLMFNDYGIHVNEYTRR